MSPNLRVEMQPRIYTYKITFVDTPYYYYGVHKEKKFNEYYMGSPKTHKWCWELYEPKKQILEIFEYSDRGYIESQQVEKRLIRYVYNTDKWCLNESCGCLISLEILRESGKKTGTFCKENKIGIFSLSSEERSEISKTNYKNGKGLATLTKEQRSDAGKKGSAKNKQSNIGIFSLSKNQLSIQGCKTNSQKWRCLETGFITNPGALTRYQKSKGIDISKRERV
jgi:hypothetical protein